MSANEWKARREARYSALLNQGTTDAKINANDKAIATFSEAIRLNLAPLPPSMSVAPFTVIRATTTKLSLTTTKPLDSIRAQRQRL